MSSSPLGARRGSTTRGAPAAPFSLWRSPFFRAFAVISLLLLEAWATAPAAPRAPRSRLRARRPLPGNLSTRCFASRGWGAARAPAARPADGAPRVLMLMMDDRAISRELPSPKDYVSIATMHNYLYAKRHGYDFATVRPARKPDRVDRYGNSIEGVALALDFNQEKRSLSSAGCFNRAIGEWRALTWCKVLALWAATADAPGDAGPAFDLVVFIDSDAVVARAHRPISDAWEAGGPPWEPGKIVYGAEGGAFPARDGPSLFLFSDRQENRWPLANLGFFVARDSPQLRPLLKTWWEAQPGPDAERFNFEPYHEQEILWRLQKWSAYANAAGRVVQVSTAQWAPLAGDYNFTGGFLQHVNSEEDGGSFGQARPQFFGKLRAQLGLDAAGWAARVAELEGNCHAVVMDFDAIDEHVRWYREGLEDLTPSQLWAPAPPPARPFPTPSPMSFPLPYPERERPFSDRWKFTLK